MGVSKTLQLVRRTYWWPKMKQDVATYIKNCPSCQMCKSSNEKPSGLLKPLPIPTTPWHSISVDFITDLPDTHKGMNSIMVVVDRLTKMTHFIPTTKDVTAEGVAHLFKREIFRLHGAPQDIVSDRDPKFVSNFWKEFTQIVGAQRNLSTSFHPRTDGQTERMNRFLEDVLRHYVAPHQKDWADHLDIVEFAINNVDQESTGYSPFFLNYGYHPRTPGCFIDTPKTTNGQVELEDHDTHKLKVQGVEHLHRQMRDCLQEARNNIDSAQQRMKLYFDKKVKQRTFVEGDMVLLSTKNVGLKKIGTRKLLPRFVGPFKVVKAVGEVAYKLALPPALRIHNTFHVSNLKPYFDDGRVQPPPLPEVIDGELEYEVEMVLNHRDVKRGKRPRREYLVRWKGYGPEHDEWIPLDNFGSTTECVKEYWEEHGVHT